MWWLSLILAYHKVAPPHLCSSAYKENWNMYSSIRMCLAISYAGAFICFFSIRNEFAHRLQDGAGSIINNVGESFTSRPSSWLPAQRYLALCGSAHN